MKRLLLLLAVGWLVAQSPIDITLGPSCSMAAHLLAAQQENPERHERQVPDGHWCQRQAARMDRRAHACNCHQHVLPYPCRRVEAERVELSP